VSGDLSQRRKGSEDFLHRVRQNAELDDTALIVRQLAAILLDVMSEIDMLRQILGAIRRDIRRGDS
jgi:hypothetical protein